MSAQPHLSCRAGFRSRVFSADDGFGEKMKAGGSQLPAAVFVFICNLFFVPRHQSTDIQICGRCSGTLLNSTRVGQFCLSSFGRIDGRCCLKNDNTSDPQRITGLDLSNCSLTHINDLPGAPSLFILDLSLNPMVNISDATFQGFLDLNYLILPPDVSCPGGNASWEKVDLEEGNRVCRGQMDVCNQTGQLSFSCPENSLCAPYGPGFFECSCTNDHHGYKCLREGQFPIFQVFGPLGAFTAAISFLLWFTQRRHVKRG
ncbi:all-trans retinoic acid-induced differentiation factor [Takifugu flavidus]|nr:all-trans retinoic acid-induced differentiation factor [Takifugu flavidus]